MLCVLAFSVVSIGIMGYYKFYFSNEDTVKEEILTDMAQKEANYVCHLLNIGKDLEYYYRDKNVYYVVSDYETKEVVYSNYSGQETIAKGTDIYHIYNYWYETDQYGNTVSHEKAIPEYYIELYVAKDMKRNDLFSVTLKIVEIGFKLQYTMIIIALSALAVLITLLCFLYCSAGHKEGEIRLNPLDKIPFDLYTAFIVFAATISVVTVIDWCDRSFIWLLYTCFVFSVDYFLGLGYTMSFATRIKMGTLFKNNLIFYTFKFLFKYVKRFLKWLMYILRNLSIIKKTIIAIGIALCFELLFFMRYINNYLYVDEFLLVAVIPINLFVIAGTLYLAITFKRIKQGGEKIAGGDLNHKIDTQYMYGDFESFAESLNNINEGLSLAINEQIKSERFKTELITNVSHDIKTPLTSIINYVDLIKKEQTDNENIKQYIEVLDRQSSKLKKLVEDLVEASKASSGVLPVNFTVCDVTVLLSQTMGEFENRLHNSNITPVLSMPETPVKIMADGRHLWRVFENLMSNICKYAMSGTRAYFDVKIKENKAVITFRNISRTQLNVTAEELMERFVRGDSSRNTEGSGLGLSIAKSLVELQNGKMTLGVDGDLFKVTLEFSLME
jgi:signal transduction histidine kinase